MSSFDLIVLGSSGGPSENGLSGYLVKTSDHHWGDGTLALEAGSGLGALHTLLEANPFLFDEPYSIDQAETDEDVVETYIRLEVNPYQRACQIYSSIRTFLLSHAHLDHVASLIVSAGSQGGPTRRITALESVISGLESIFAGKLWPRLAVRVNEPAPPSFYVYDPITPGDSYHAILAPNISIRAAPVSHGECSQSPDGVYESSAFFVRNNTTLGEFLFFGDVEADSISHLPRTRPIWVAAAGKIISGKLSTIFLECSWREDQPKHDLFGHMSPSYVVEELTVLAAEVTLARSKLARGASPVTPGAWRSSDPVLTGITLVVIHCKDPSDPLPIGHTISQLIVAQIVRLLDPLNLGISVYDAVPGMHIRI